MLAYSIGTSKYSFSRVFPITHGIMHKSNVISKSLTCAETSFFTPLIIGINVFGESAVALNE